MWAFGVVLYEMKMGRPPFPFGPGHVAAVKQGRYDKLPRGHYGASDALAELIAGLLKVDPKERFSPEEALWHRFYQNVPILQEGDIIVETKGVMDAMDDYGDQSQGSV
jgi:serine/threonine protein kinase